MLDARTDTIAGLESEVAAMDEQIAQLEERRQALATELNISEEDRAALMDELGRLRDRSQSLTEQLAEQEEQTVLAQEEIEEREIRIEELTQGLAQAEEGRDRLEQQLTEEVSLRSEAEALTELLNLQVAELRGQLREVQEALEASEAMVSAQDVEIADLNARLNQALIRRIEELSSAQSDFFGSVREIIGDRPDIRIVGDRFVLQSGLLFESGEASLRPENLGQLRDIAQTILEVSEQLPENIDWVLRVDGHTDNQPIATPEFPSNWELSTARATAVVQFLIDEGLPPDRLAAAGFGEHQPIASNATPEGREANRRIEMRIDQGLTAADEPGDETTPPAQNDAAIPLPAEDG